MIGTASEVFPSTLVIADMAGSKTLPVTLFMGATGIPAELQATASSLLLSTEREAYELSTDRLECRAGGHNDTIVFLRHPSMPDAEISVERIHAEKLDHLPQVQVSLAAAPRLVRRQRLVWSAIAAAALIVMGLMLTALVLLGRTLL